MRQIVSGVLAMVLLASVATAAPKFVQPPQASRSNDGGAVIAFEASEPTDVAVVIEDAAGRVVRHLAAGVLGANAPAPLKADSLRQQLAWDGLDDDGQPAAGGPFVARVGLGLRGDYGGTAFADYQAPNVLTGVCGLAVGPEGRLYVMGPRWHKGWWRAITVSTFTRAGRYEKTIKPFSASLPPERVRAITALESDGRPMPTIYRLIAMTFYPNEDMAQQPAVTPDGNLHSMVLPPAYKKWPAKQIATIDADGGIPYPSYAGEDLGGPTSPGEVYLTASLDGKTLFATGIERDEAAGRPNVHAVFAIALPGRNKARVLFGQPREAGNDQAHLNNPHGIAADAKRLYVADTGNNRIAVIDQADGKFVGSIAVEAPDWVGVDRNSGAVYAHSGNKVIKFDGYRNGKRQAELTLPTSARAKWCFALDDQARPPVLWVGRNEGDDCLTRSTIEGDAFSPLVRADYTPGRTFWNISTGQDGKTVACKVGNSDLRLLDETTGQLRDLRLEGEAGQTYRLGPDNQIYGMDHWRWGIRRWDSQGKKLPFADSADDPAFKGRLWNVPSGTTSWERDFCVDRQGNIYTKQRGKAYHGRMRVDEYDKDGKFKRTVLWVVTDGMLGPKLDRQGNLYVAEAIKPVGVPYPKFFDGKLPGVRVDTKGDVAYQYRWMYGSIAKFSPKGGAFWYPVVRPEFDLYAFEGEPALDANLARQPFEWVGGDRMNTGKGEVQGALWTRFGCSFVLDMHPSHNRRCHCTATDFDVDAFGRVFYPDQGRFRTVVTDTNGNEITTIGGYGNQDDAVGRIASTWIVGLGVTDRYLYLADALNRQVQRAKLTYAAQAACKVN